MMNNLPEVQPDFGIKSMKHDKAIELFPGERELSRPLFKSDAEYQHWVDSFYYKVAPDLEKLRIQQLKSQAESLTRIVN